MVYALHIKPEILLCRTYCQGRAEELQKDALLIQSEVAPAVIELIGHSFVHSLHMSKHWGGRIT